MHTSVNAIRVSNHRKNVATRAGEETLLVNLRCRRQGTQDCRCIPPITGKRNRQGGRQLQRKHPGIHFHRAWILVAGQSLNNFLRLPVVKHVHDVAVSKRMRCHRNRKMHRRTRPLRVKKLFEERTPGSIRKRPRPFQAKRLKKSKK